MVIWVFCFVLPQIDKNTAQITNFVYDFDLHKLCVNVNTLRQTIDTLNSSTSSMVSCVGFDKSICRVFSTVDSIYFLDVRLELSHCLSCSLSLHAWITCDVKIGSSLFVQMLQIDKERCVRFKILIQLHPRIYTIALRKSKFCCENVECCWSPWNAVLLPLGWLNVRDVIMLGLLGCSHTVYGSRIRCVYHFGRTPSADTGTASLVAYIINLIETSIKKNGGTCC